MEYIEEIGSRLRILNKYKIELISEINFYWNKIFILFFTILFYTIYFKWYYLNKSER